MIFMSTAYARQAVGRAHENTPNRISPGATPAAYQPSSPLVGDELYFITESGGLVTCLDAHTGEKHQERIGGNYSASPTHSNGRIYFHSREG